MTAQRFMQVHNNLASKNNKLLDLELPVSGLYLLAAPSTPEEARDAVIELAELDLAQPAALGRRLRPFCAGDQRRGLNILGRFDRVFGDGGFLMPVDVRLRKLQKAILVLPPDVLGNSTSDCRSAK